jgi:hypothetical protein
MTCSSTLRRRLALEQALVREHLEEHGAEREEVAAVVRAQLDHHLRRHVGGLAVRLESRVPLWVAMPKSISFTVPSRVIMMLLGLMSRWTMAERSNTYCRRGRPGWR